MSEVSSRLRGRCGLGGTSRAALVLVALAAVAMTSCSLTEPAAAKVDGVVITQGQVHRDLQSAEKAGANVKGSVDGSWDPVIAAQVLNVDVTLLLIEQFAADKKVPLPAAVDMNAGIQEKVQLIQKLSEAVGKRVQSELASLPQAKLIQDFPVLASAICGELVFGADKAVVEAALASPSEGAGQAKQVQSQELCITDESPTAQYPPELLSAITGSKVGETSKVVAVAGQMGEMFVGFRRTNATVDQLAGLATQQMFLEWFTGRDVWVNSRYGVWDPKGPQGPAVYPPKAPAETGEEVQLPGVNMNPFGSGDIQGPGGSQGSDGAPQGSGGEQQGPHQGSGGAPQPQSPDGP